MQSARIQPGLALPTQAWLTEIQEYAQHNVVLMLLGNKVGTQPVLSTLALQGSEGGRGGGPEPWVSQDPCARWTLPRSVW